MLQHKNSLPYCFQPAEQPKPRGQWFADMVNDWNKRTGRNLLEVILEERQKSELAKAQSE